jgi:hypothetical protein
LQKERTLLHEFASTGNMEVVAALLAAKANIEEKDKVNAVDSI